MKKVLAVSVILYFAIAAYGKYHDSGGMMKPNDCPLCGSSEVDLDWTYKLDGVVVSAALGCDNCNLIVDAPGDKNMVVALWNQLAKPKD